MTIFAIPQSAPENTSVKDIYKPKKIHDFLCIFFFRTHQEQVF